MFLLLPSNSAQSVVPESVLISSVPVSLLVKIEDACLNLGLFFFGHCVQVRLLHLLDISRPKIEHRHVEASSKAIRDR